MAEAEPATVTCKICLGNIKQEVKFNDLTLSSILEYPTKNDLNITKHPVACDKCRVEIETKHQLYMQNAHIVIKEEIKKEDNVKTEGIVEDQCVLFNTDIPLFVEESVPVNILYCYQCNYGTNDKQNLTNHIFAHRFKCNICNDTCTKIDLLVEHTAMHTATNEVKYQQSLSKHSSYIKKLSVERSFCCDQCDYKTNANWKLKRHKRIHSEEKPFKCNLCDYTTKNAGHLKIHIKIHSGERNFSCDQCDYKTYCNGKLKSHKIVHSKEKPYKCSLCDFATKFATHLKKHIKMHSGERNFNCDQRNISCNQCDYKTNSNGNLKSHKRVHSEEIPYKCNLCDFASKYEGSLKLHLKIHSGERSFSCDHCDYKTYSNWILKRHNTVHFEEKLYKCNLCDYTGKCASYLKNHMKRHSDEGNFSCDKCDYKAYSNSRLTRHKRVHVNAIGLITPGDLIRRLEIDSVHRNFSC